MNDWYHEKQVQVKAFLGSYGRVTLLMVLVLITLAGLLSLVLLLSPTTLRVSFLDVGQGDAILIQTPSGHDMLVDGGADGKVLERVASQLSYFDRTIDVVVATHGDADHVTGLIPILKKYDVGHVVMSPIKSETGIFSELEKSVRSENAIVHVGKKGDVIDFGDGVVVHILYPSGTFHGSNTDTNAASVSMVITYGDESVLLTGDLPSSHEDELIGSVLPKKVTIYKAGHHGSKSSSGDQLLSYITPEYSVISAGKDNRYGHPNSEALTRLTTYSQEVLSTIDRGTITFTLDGISADIQTTK